MPDGDETGHSAPAAVLAAAIDIGSSAMRLHIAGQDAQGGLRDSE